MKTYKILVPIAVMAFIIVFSSCKKDEGSGINESIILIDSIIHQDTVVLGDTLNIKFYGMIGNGCDYFSRFEELDLDEGESINTLKLRILRKTEDNAFCTEELKYLDGAEINLRGMLAGDFFLRIGQPDGSFLESKAYIQE
jgi:hypothetical protein